MTDATLKMQVEGTDSVNSARTALDQLAAAGGPVGTALRGMADASAGTTRAMNDVAASHRAMLDQMRQQSSTLSEINSHTSDYVDSLAKWYTGMLAIKGVGDVFGSIADGMSALGRQAITIDTALVDFAKHGTDAFQIMDSKVLAVQKSLALIGTTAGSTGAQVQAMIQSLQNVATPQQAGEVFARVQAMRDTATPGSMAARNVYSAYGIDSSRGSNDDIVRELISALRGVAPGAARNAQAAAAFGPEGVRMVNSTDPIFAPSDTDKYSARMRSDLARMDDEARVRKMQTDEANRQWNDEHMGLLSSGGRDRGMLGLQLGTERLMGRDTGQGLSLGSIGSGLSTWAQTLGASLSGSTPEHPANWLNTVRDWTNPDFGDVMGMHIGRLLPQGPQMSPIMPPEEGGNKTRLDTTKAAPVDLNAMKEGWADLSTAGVNVIDILQKMSEHTEKLTDDVQKHKITMDQATAATTTLGIETQRLIDPEGTELIHRSLQNQLFGYAPGESRTVQSQLQESRRTYWQGQLRTGAPLPEGADPMRLENVPMPASMEADTRASAAAGISGQLADTLRTAMNTLTIATARAGGAKSGGVWGSEVAGLQAQRDIEIERNPSGSDSIRARFQAELDTQRADQQRDKELDVYRSLQESSARQIDINARIANPLGPVPGATTLERIHRQNLGKYPNESQGFSDDLGADSGIGGGLGGGGGGLNMAAAMQAIKDIESSGGNYGALGKIIPKTGDRAYGAYQVMGDNVPSWSKQWYGQSLNPQQFLANKDAQDAVFKGQFGMYADKYGPEGAGRAWLGGEGGMNNLSARDPNGTAVGAYGSDFSRRYQGYVGGGGAVPAGGSGGNANAGVDFATLQSETTQTSGGAASMIQHMSRLIQTTNDAIKASQEGGGGSAGALRSVRQSTGMQQMETSLDEQIQAWEQSATTTKEEAAARQNNIATLQKERAELVNLTGELAKLNQTRFLSGMQRSQTQMMQGESVEIMAAQGGYNKYQTAAVTGAQKDISEARAQNIDITPEFTASVLATNTALQAMHKTLDDLTEDQKSWADMAKKIGDDVATSIDNFATEGGKGITKLRELGKQISGAAMQEFVGGPVSKGISSFMTTGNVDMGATGTAASNWFGQLFGGKSQPDATKMLGTASQITAPMVHVQGANVIVSGAGGAAGVNPGSMSSVAGPESGSSSVNGMSIGSLPLMGQPTSGAQIPSPSAPPAPNPLAGMGGGGGGSLMSNAGQNGGTGTSFWGSMGNSLFNNPVGNALGYGGNNTFSSAWGNIFGASATAPMDDLGGIAGGLGGGAGGGGLFSGIGDFFSSLFHDGGIVGAPGHGKPVLVNPDWFVRAPRMHLGGRVGLQNDEMPIIAQKGERIIPKGQSQGGEGQSVTIHNHNTIYANDAHSFRATKNQMDSDSARTARKYQVRQGSTSD